MSMGSPRNDGIALGTSTCRLGDTRRNRRGPLACIAMFAAALAVVALSVCGARWVLNASPPTFPEDAGARCLLDVTYDLAHHSGFDEVPPSIPCASVREETRHR